LRLLAEIQLEANLFMQPLRQLGIQEVSPVVVSEKYVNKDRMG